MDITLRPSICTGCDYLSHAEANRQRCRAYVDRHQPDLCHIVSITGRRWMPMFLSHETMHSVLTKLEGPEVGIEAFDRLSPFDGVW